MNLFPKGLWYDQTNSLPSIENEKSLNNLSRKVKNLCARGPGDTRNRMTGAQGAVLPTSPRLSPPERPEVGTYGSSGPPRCRSAWTSGRTCGGGGLCIQLKMPVS